MSAAVEFEAQIDEGWVVKDRSSYRAYGDFRGKQIAVRSTTQSGAESKWRDEANHKANEYEKVAQVHHKPGKKWGPVRRRTRQKTECVNSLQYQARFRGLRP